MRTKIFFLIALLCAGLFAYAYSGAAIFVPEDYEKIQDAIAAASYGDTVRIAPGIYDKRTQIFPIQISDGITLEGSGSDSTIIDATDAAAGVLLINNSTTTRTQVRSMVIRGGSSPLGSGIKIDNSTGVILFDVVIKDNATTDPLSIGGGVYIKDSNVIMNNCSIINNSADRGAGIAADGHLTYLTVTDSKINRNIAAGIGGGICFYDGKRLALNRCEIAYNSGSAGFGGIVCDNPTADVNELQMDLCNVHHNTNGGLYVVSYESGNVHGSSFSFNTGGGGGIAITDKYNNIKYSANRIFRNYSAYNSPAILSHTSDSDFYNNFIFRNRSAKGGTVQFDTGANGRFVFNTVVFNEVTTATLPLAERGIVTLVNAHKVISNNIIAFNAGIGFVEVSISAQPTFNSNCIFANTEGAYYDNGASLYNTEFDINNNVTNAPYPTPTNNVIRNPLFKDPNVNDFRLHGQSQIKDIADATITDPPEDWEGSPRTGLYVNNLPDIGADEVTYPRVGSAVYFDYDQNTFVNQGDKIVLQFDRPLVQHAQLAATHIKLPVIGDTLGASSFLTLNSKNPSQLIINLGLMPKLTIDGVFSDANVAASMPSGIDIAAIGGLPISDAEGLVPVHHGLVAGTYQYTPDIKPAGKKTELTLSPGLAQTLQINAGGFLRNSRLEFASDSLLLPVTLRLSASPTPDFSLSAVVLEVVSGYLLIDPNHPIRIVLDYNVSELDVENGDFPGEFRIFKFLQTGPSSQEWQYVNDAYGNSQVVDEVNGTVSVYIYDIYNTKKRDYELFKKGHTPSNSKYFDSPQPVIVFANLPLEIISENTKVINKTRKQNAPVAAVNATPFLSPNTNCYYPQHKIEFPGYTESASGIQVKIRKPKLAERMNFPSESNSIFVIETKDTATSVPVSFADPVNVTVEYRDRADDPTFRDIVYSDETDAIEGQMKIVKYNETTGVFDFVSPDTNKIDRVYDIVSQDTVSDLTSTGRGIYGNIADPDAVHNGDFSTNTDGWLYGFVPGVNHPEGIGGAGSLTQLIVEPNEFGFWVSPPNQFPLVKDKTYFMSYKMTSTIAPLKIPTIRMRMFPGNFEYQTNINMNPYFANGYNMPMDALPRTYHLFYTPPSAMYNETTEDTSIYTAYDIIHFSGDSSVAGPVDLDEFTVQLLDNDTLKSGFTSVQRWDFNTDEEGFIGGYLGAGDVADMTWQDGAITLTSHTNNTFSFYNKVTDINVEPGKLYKVVATIRCNVLPANEVAMFRLRAGTNDNQYWQVSLFTSTGVCLTAPSMIPNEYDMYFYPEQDSIRLFSDKLVLAIDIVNIETIDNPECTFYIDSVEVFAQDFVY